MVKENLGNVVARGGTRIRKAPFHPGPPRRLIGEATKRVRREPLHALPRYLGHRPAQDAGIDRYERTTRTAVVRPSRHGGLNRRVRQRGMGIGDAREERIGRPQRSPRAVAQKQPRLDDSCRILRDHLRSRERQVDRLPGTQHDRRADAPVAQRESRLVVAATKPADRPDTCGRQGEHEQ